MLVSVQALGVVCKVKCSLPGYRSSQNQDEAQQSHESCHSQTQEEDENSNSDDCGDICKTDELISESKVWKMENTIQGSNDFLVQLIDVHNFTDCELAYNILTHDPPGLSFYNGVPIFIQKSSYLI